MWTLATSREIDVYGKGGGEANRPNRFPIHMVLLMVGYGRTGVHAGKMLKKMQCTGIFIRARGHTSICPCRKKALLEKAHHNKAHR